MRNEFNIYCDESCHLHRDGNVINENESKVMSLGALSCPKSKRREISDRIREIKQAHGLKKDFEIKWTKVSGSKIEFYLDIVNYFFDNSDLHFRILVIGDKTELNHSEFDQTHDDWYYKMFFHLLEPMFSPDIGYNIYLDKKDTLGGEKVSTLHDTLCNKRYDFDRQIIRNVQIIHSHEVEQMQLCDLLMGAVTYANRELTGNSGKVELIELIRRRSGKTLMNTTLLREDKFNIFQWHSRGL